MKNLFNVDENEKQRILESHVKSSKNQYLNLIKEQSESEEDKSEEEKVDEYLDENLPETIYFKYVKGNKTIQFQRDEASAGIEFDNVNKLTITGTIVGEIDSEVMVIIDCNESNVLRWFRPESSGKSIEVEITYETYLQRGMKGWKATSDDKEFKKVIRNSNFCYAGRNKTTRIGNKPKFKDPNQTPAQTPDKSYGAQPPAKS
jgi:hypothetical protein